MSQYPSFLLPKQEQTVKSKKDKRKMLKSILQILKWEVE